MRPTIALCIPAYNAAWCLPRLLASAHNQEIPFDEILVYDDCSSDNTAGVARELGATVISGPQNVGCSAGKNALLGAARSAWIHFHDADDELLPNFTRLAHCWINLGQACPDVVLFAYEYRDNDTHQLILTRRFSDEELRRDPVGYAITTQINPFCGLYRKTRLIEVGGYDLDPEILYNEDVAFHCKLALEGLTFAAEDEAAIINHRVIGSMSCANKLRCTRAQHAVLRRVATRAGRSHGPQIAQRLWKIAGLLAADDLWAEADEALNLATKLCPGLPAGESHALALACRLLGPHHAFRLRERFIRRFKPRLRRPLSRRCPSSVS